MVSAQHSRDFGSIFHADCAWTIVLNMGIRTTISILTKGTMTIAELCPWYIWRQVVMSPSMSTGGMSMGNGMMGNGMMGNGMTGNGMMGGGVQVVEAGGKGGMGGMGGMGAMLSACCSTEKNEDGF